MIKQCSECKKKLSSRSFYRDIQKKDGLTANCNLCRRVRYVKRYKENREKIIEKTREYQKKNKEYIKNWVSKKYKENITKIFNILGNECKRCGEKNKYVLQVDHINGDGHYDRKFFFDNYKKRMLGELENGETKYQLLCANCNLIEGIEKGYKKCIWKK